jgi:hypothetical protein
MVRPARVRCGDGAQGCGDCSDAHLAGRRAGAQPAQGLLTAQSMLPRLRHITWARNGGAMSQMWLDRNCTSAWGCMLCGQLAHVANVAAVHAGGCMDVFLRFCKAGVLAAF